MDACGPRCNPTSTDEHSQNHSQFRSDNGDAARACLPIDDGGFTTAILGELGWEPPNQSRHGEEPATVTNDGKKPHASDERVKVSPSSARLSPSGIGNLTARALLADAFTQGSAKQSCSYNVSPANQSGTAHCCVISAAAPALMPKDKRLLMDTGCGYDLADAEFAALFPHAKEHSQNQVDLHSANALIEINLSQPCE